jgi:hypothetical protein
LTTVCEAVLVAVLAMGCGGVMQAQSIPFTEHGSTQQSGHDSAAGIAVGTDPTPLGLGALASRDGSRMYIGVFAGTRNTGGYGIRVVGVDRAGDTLTVRAMFSSPPPGSLTIQVLTSPAELVSIDRQAAAGAREALLVDQSGSERARVTVPQSQP